MLTIKLRRIGKKHQASFRIIVSEKRSKLDGRYVEDLGWLNPRNDEVKVNNERAEYWLKNGAQPTDTVHNLLVKIGLIKGPKRAVHAKSKKKPLGESVGEDQPQQKEKTVKDETPKENQAETSTSAEQAEQPVLTENE